MHSKLIAQTFGATSPVPYHVEMDDSDSSSSESGESCVPRPYIPKGKGKGRPASEVFAPISPVPYDVEMDDSDSSSNESGESHVPKPPLPKGKGKGPPPSQVFAPDAGRRLRLRVVRRLPLSDCDCPSCRKGWGKGWRKGWRKGWGKGSGKGWGKDKVDPPSQATAQTPFTAGASAAAVEELHASGQVLLAESASESEPDPEPEEEPEAEPDSCA